jgi:hypothetical protein
MQILKLIGEAIAFAAALTGILAFVTILAAIMHA